MRIPTRPITIATAVAVIAAGCVSDGSSESEPDATSAIPDISVTVPPLRLTPFCETMIDLSDRLRLDDVDDAEALIIETYRSIVDQVPEEISADFDAVLAALEAGAPPPTDPPLPTTPTTEVPPEPSSTSTTTDDGSGGAQTVPTSEPGVDVGYQAGTSPSERINNYVTLVCRATQNNPGPQATAPLSEPPDSTP